MIRLVNEGTATVQVYDAGNLTARSSFNTNVALIHNVVHNQGKEPFEVIATSVPGGRHHYSYTRDDGGGTVKGEGINWNVQSPNQVDVYLWYIPGGVARVKLYFV